MSTENPVVETDDTLNEVTATTELEEKTEVAAVIKPEDHIPAQEEKDIDNPSKDDELESDNIDEETQFVEIDGKEISLGDIKKGLQSTFMQSDYTKKTTEHAQFAKKEREEIALDRENLSKTKEEVSGLRDKLAVLVAEDESIDWTELKENEPEEYIRLKEKADERKEALAKVKAERETPADDPVFIEEQRQLFWESHPEWVDKNNKPTDIYKADIELLNKYAVSAGYTAEEFGKMTSSRQLNTLLKAAKFDALQEKGNEIREKRTKIPVVTKPKVKVNSSDHGVTAGSAFFPNVKSG